MSDREVEEAQVLLSIQKSQITDNKDSIDTNDNVLKKRSKTIYTALVVLTIVTTIVYMDRGIIASNGVNGSAPTKDNPQGHGIQGYFNITDFQDGLLPAMFMVGLLVLAPVFSELSATISPWQLLAFGLCIWVAGVYSCGGAWSFTSMLIFRTIVGGGEASFCSLAQPFIDDFAPKKYKSLWLAVYNAALPVGNALGYVVGGLVGVNFGWRSAFILEGTVMLPLVVIAYMLPSLKPVQVDGKFTVEGAQQDYQRTEIEGSIIDKLKKQIRYYMHSINNGLVMFWKNIKELTSYVFYDMVAIAYSLHIGFIGVLSFWGPRAAREIFSMERAFSDSLFGILTVATGITGTIAGGALLDYVGQNIKNAAMICAIGETLSLIFFFVAFLVSQNFYIFLVVFTFGEFLLFSTNAPVAGLQLWSVPNRLRPQAFGFITILCHVLGDVPSAPLAGYIQQNLHNFRYTLALFLIYVLVASAIYIALYLYEVYKNRNNQDFENLQDSSCSVQDTQLQHTAGNNQDIEK